MHDKAELPFSWLLYMGRNLRPDSASDPFSSSLPHHFRPSLVAARARADCLDIQSCIFLVFCADRKGGTEQSYLNILQCREHRESPELPTDE